MGAVLALFSRGRRHDGEAEIRDVQRLRLLLKPYSPESRARMLRYVQQVLNEEENNYVFEET